MKWVIITLTFHSILPQGGEIAPQDWGGGVFGPLARNYIGQFHIVPKGFLYIMLEGFLHIMLDGFLHIVPNARVPAYCAG